MITRTEERRDTNWIAMIRIADGTEIPCTVRDVSKSGARLGVPSNCALPDSFRFKVLGQGFVFSVKLAWRRGEYVGVVIEQVAKLKSQDQKNDAIATAQPADEPAYLLHARRSRYSSR